MDYSYLIHLCDCLQALALLCWMYPISLPRNSYLPTLYDIATEFNYIIRIIK